MKFSLLFGLLGLALVVGIGIQIVGDPPRNFWVIAIEAYLAVGFLTLSSLYALRFTPIPDRVFFRHGRNRAVTRLALGSYSIIAGAVLRGVSLVDGEPLMDEVAPGIFVGRRPFLADRNQLDRSRIGAILNLCFEFPTPRSLRKAPGLVSINLPLLDGVAPTDAQFSECVDLVRTWRQSGRNVLIHCAQGHGRSVTIAAAVLCAEGLASTPADAIQSIRDARPRARPSRAQVVALERYWERRKA